MTGSELHGRILGDYDTVDICWCSLPMGFSWSLLFCQHVVSDFAERSLNCPESVLMRDRQPPAIFRFRQGPSGVEVTGKAHYVYVDNLGVASGSRRDTDSGVQKIVGGLEAQGLMAHEVSVEVQAGPLGVAWDGARHRTSISRKRFWRVTQAVRFVLSRLRVSRLGMGVADWAYYFLRPTRARLPFGFSFNIPVHQETLHGSSSTLGLSPR